MKLKIRFPGKILPFRKPPTESNLPSELPKDRNQNGFIIALLILWLLIFIISLTKCKAQDVHGLKIGDQVPDVTINHIIDYPDSTSKFSDFKGKLLILDFWATWCSSCISTFPKMYSLQNEFPDLLQILLVNCRSTRDSEERIKRFLLKRKTYYHFASVVQDTTLERIFPHYTIPHYVWIKDQVVIAITDASEVTEKNIKQLIGNSNVGLVEKTFIKYDIRKPLFADENGGEPVCYIYRAILTGYKEGLQAYLGFHGNDQGMVDRIDVLNCSKMGLIKFAFPEFVSFGADRTIINVAYSESFSTDSNSRPWKRRNCFSYESIFPSRTRDEALAIMRSDIQTYFHVHVDTVVRAADCFILTVGDSSKMVRAVGGAHPESNIIEQTGAPVYFLDFLIGSIARQIENYYRVPFIDETGFLSRVNIFLPANYKDEKALTGSLLKQGIKLKKGKRNIVFLVISDQSNSKYIHNTN